jgi:hypothetical protein
MDSLRYTRTPKGHQEIVQGRKALKGKLRTVLFLIDAGKPADEIQRQILVIGAPEDALAQLQAAGFVAPVGDGSVVEAPVRGNSIEDQVAQFRVAKAFMNDTIVDALGIRAFTFTLRLERCATVADLIKLLPDYTTALVKKLDREAARALVGRTSELLSGIGH